MQLPPIERLLPENAMFPDWCVLQLILSSTLQCWPGSRLAVLSVLSHCTHRRLTTALLQDVQNFNWPHSAATNRAPVAARHQFQRACFQPAKEDTASPHSRGAALPSWSLPAMWLTCAGLRSHLLPVPSLRSWQSACLCAHFGLLYSYHGHCRCTLCGCTTCHGCSRCCSRRYRGSAALSPLHFPFYDTSPTLALVRFA